MESLRKNDTWDLVALPDGRRNISSKWVFNIKTNATCHVEKFKARLVAKGYSQVKGVDFGEIFSPIEKLTYIRLLMSLDIVFDLKIRKMDMKHLEGFTIKEKEELVCRLKKSLYGLKLSPRMW